MKTFHTILIFALATLGNPLAAQLPELEVRTPTPGTYEMLQASHFIKPQISFRLYGNVREICETTTFHPKNGEDQLLKTAYYEFSPEQRLTLYLEDTMKSLKNSNAKIEKYFFEGNRLFKVEKYSGLQQNASKTVTTFDRDGFVIKEVFERYDSWTQPPVPGIFDYTLDYYWDAERDTVELRYTYKTKHTSYERFTDNITSFVEEKKAVQKNNDLVDLMHFGTSEHVTYDDRGNLTRLQIIDNTIKSSYNINQLYEYKYNDKNDLTEIAFYMSGPQGASKYELVYRYRISYSDFDEKENWTLKKILDDQGNVYEFRREIAYH